MQAPLRSSVDGCPEPSGLIEELDFFDPAIASKPEPLGSTIGFGPGSKAREGLADRQSRASPAFDPRASMPPASPCGIPSSLPLQISVSFHALVITRRSTESPYKIKC